uniref:Uncharacterized protein n=1 Tax=Physcomitrium patens TaxID=3218 RepID=A0A2K1KNF2_PHYPA|nr:hypothetical protein PHYPA_006209 [Physcomitrium patens]
MSKETFKDKNPHTSKPLKSIHTNVCGSIKTKSTKGFTYFFIYIIDYSRFMSTYF